MASINFDSRVNYQKIYLNSTVDVTCADPNASVATTIIHNLGRIPNVRVWFTNRSGNISTAVSDAAGSNLYPLTSDYTQQSCYYTVNTTQLTITFARGVTVGATRTTTIYYRIYLDPN